MNYLSMLSPRSSSVFGYSKISVIALTGCLFLTSCNQINKPTGEIITESGIIITNDVQKHINVYTQEYTDNMMRIHERQIATEESQQTSQQESETTTDTTTPTDEPETVNKSTEIKEEYLGAMDAIFTKSTLTKKQINTLINVATILPEALENETILARLTVSNPPLSRLVNQHMVWEEIESTQRLEVQKLQQQRIEDNEKREQQLDIIVTEFKQKIGEYDKKIVEHEKKVKAIQ